MLPLISDVADDFAMLPLILEVAVDFGWRSASALR